MGYLKIIYSYLKRCLGENSLDFLLWSVRGCSWLGGCDTSDREECGASLRLRWAVGAFVIVYAYIVGGFVYNETLADSLEQTMRGMCCIFTGVIVLNKLCWFIFQRKSIKNLLKLTQTNNNLVPPVLHEGRLSRLMRTTKAHCFFYSFFVMFTIILRATRPLYTDQILPDKYSVISICAGLEPVDVNPNYGICLMLLELELFSTTFTVCLYESMFMIFVEHTAAVLGVLADDFQNLVPEDVRDESDFTENYKDSDGFNTNGLMIEVFANEDFVTMQNISLSTHIQLSGMTYRHGELIETLQELQRAYSVSIGLDFGVGIIVLSIAISLYPVASDAIADLVFFCLIECFIYCFLGQRLTDAASRLERAVYSCGWENFDVVHQKSIFINLIQAQKPVSLLAANVIPLQKETFGTILGYVYKIGAAFRN